jgi:hypothetical protein
MLEIPSGLAMIQDHPRLIRIDPDFDPCQGEGALQHELSHLAAISTFSRGLSYL